jgi:hypothetical protein
MTAMMESVARWRDTVREDGCQLKKGQYQVPSLVVFFAGTLALLTGLAAPASGQAILSPDKLVFHCGTGQRCAPQTTTLTNEGTETVTISSINLNSGKFVVTNNCGTTLKAGRSCSITVSTIPMPKGNFTGALIVNDSAPNSPQKALLALIGS